MRVPGACGELWQGTLDGEQPALITCPIDWYTEAVVVLNDEQLWAYSNDVPKSVQAVRATLALLGASDRGFTLQIVSDLPRAKGFGSSTADVAASAYATVRALGREISPRQVAGIAVAIEPSDGLMFPGLALFDHRGGKVYEDLGPAPDIKVVALDFEGEVDTLEYNANYRTDLLRGMVSEHREALAAIRRGLREGNLEDVGHGATLSARTHQQILYKPQLEKVIRLAKNIEALGVCAAHSGTAMGVLLDGQRQDDSAVAAFLVACLSGLVAVSVHRMVGGGCD